MCVCASASRQGCSLLVFFGSALKILKRKMLRYVPLNPQDAVKHYSPSHSFFLKKIQTPFFCARFVLWYAIHRGGDADDIIVHNPALFAFGENLKNERPRTAFKAVLGFCFREHFVSALDHSLTFLPRNYIWALYRGKFFDQIIPIWVFGSFLSHLCQLRFSAFIFDQSGYFGAILCSLGHFSGHFGPAFQAKVCRFAILNECEQ